RQHLPLRCVRQHRRGDRRSGRVKEFAYARPDAIDHAVQLVATDGARFLAGGTNLVDLMKLGVETPSLLVDVTGVLPGDITDDYGGLRIGAGASNSDLAANPLVR